MDGVGSSPDVAELITRCNPKGDLVQRARGVKESWIVIGQSLNASNHIGKHFGWLQGGQEVGMTAGIPGDNDYSPANLRKAKLRRVAQKLACSISIGVKQPQETYPVFPVVTSDRTTHVLNHDSLGVETNCYCSRGKEERVPRIIDMAFSGQ
jgi:hypothetical protein